MRRLFIGGVLVALVLVAAGCKFVVTPAAPSNWFFFNEGATGSGYYVNGPGTPPAGRGSALLTVDGTGRESIASAQFAGLALAAINPLQYSTYQAYSGSANEAPTLAFDIDYDSTDTSTAYQGRLVYVPQMAGSVLPHTWQTWDTQSGAAAWYSSASGGSPYRPIVGDATQPNPQCTQTTFCTWAQVLSLYPNARIRPTVANVPGLLLVRAGGPVSGGFVGAVDNVVFGINGTPGEFNFEPGDGHVTVNSASAAKLGFAFATESANGSGAFVSGPNGADGSGSAQLTVDGTGGEALATGLYAGTRFDQLSFLSYKTYQPNAGSNATTLQLDADYDSTDGSTAFQGRLVFEPGLSGESVTSQTWQTWNPLETASGWWQTGNAIVNGVSVGKACTEANPCSFAEVLAAYPNAAIRPIVNQSSGQPNGGGIWLKAGGGWSGGFTGNVDSLTVAVNLDGAKGTATYDLEP